jgi:hypothetical protein
MDKKQKGLRGYFCWLLGHRYHPIWFKPAHPSWSEAYAGIPDTEYGCVYCGKAEPNMPFDPSDIDWQKTTHRKALK